MPTGVLVDTLDIARWQFAIITVYHFLFVPITIGLSAIVASYETAWVRTRNPKWLRLTKFFGKLFLINFAIGVVTGIVQEFQFGMNWSDYSRFVGDIFGAPLAVEGLLAFFLESTFLGLWIFGWDKLPRGLHAATMWLVHVGTLFSAWFILAANLYPKERNEGDRVLYLKAVRLGAAVLLVAGLGVAITGDAQGKIMTEV